MKEYVLDEPVSAAALPGEPMDALALARRAWWRPFLLVVLLEPIALAILYVLLSGGSSASRAEPAAVAPMAAFSPPRAPAPAVAPPEQEAKPVPPSRIVQERGRYVVDLHDATPGAALAMLTQATKAHVAGAAIFLGSPLRLTRSALAPSPRDAWQAVFGDVASFAITCAANACEVRFVSLVKSGAPTAAPFAPVQELVQGEAETAAPAVPPPAQTAPAQAPAVAAPLPGADPPAAEN